MGCILYDGKRRCLESSPLGSIIEAPYRATIIQCYSDLACVKLVIYYSRNRLIYKSHRNPQHYCGLCPCTSDYKSLSTRFSKANGSLKENEEKILSLENEVYQRTAAFEALRADGLLVRQVRSLI